MITILDPGPFPYAALPAPLRADRTFRECLAVEIRPLQRARFRLIRIALSELKALLSAPEAFLEAEDGEAQYARVLDLAERYRTGGETALWPLVVVAHPDYFGWWVIDGLHRLAAAGEAGLPALQAFELLNSERITGGIPRS
jgi:hypothetical protein